MRGPGHVKRDWGFSILYPITQESFLKLTNQTKTKVIHMAYLCDDILGMIGGYIEPARKEAKKKDFRQFIARRDMFWTTDREFKKIVETLADHKKPLTIKNMRYKYVKKEIQYQCFRPIWTWRDSLEERGEKIVNHENNRRGR